MLIPMMYQILIICMLKYTQTVFTQKEEVPDVMNELFSKMTIKKIVFLEIDLKSLSTIARKLSMLV